MIDTVFGPEENTIEVCSHSVKVKNDNGNCFTVDLNPATNPDLIYDAQSLSKVESNSFNRWRAEPLYNRQNSFMACIILNCRLPQSFYKLGDSSVQKLILCCFYC